MLCFFRNNASALPQYLCFNAARRLFFLYFCSRISLPRTPLMNRADFSVPNCLASSTASLTATFTGTFSSPKHPRSREHHRSAAVPLPRSRRLSRGMDPQGDRRHGAIRPPFRARPSRPINRSIPLLRRRKRVLPPRSRSLLPSRTRRRISPRPYPSIRRGTIPSRPIRLMMKTRG